MSLKSAVFLAVVIFSFFSLLLFVQHEYATLKNGSLSSSTEREGKSLKNFIKMAVDPLKLSFMDKNPITEALHDYEEELRNEVEQSVSTDSARTSLEPKKNDINVPIPVSNKKSSLEVEVTPKNSAKFVPIPEIEQQPSIEEEEIPVPILPDKFEEEEHLVDITENLTSPPAILESLNNEIEIQDDDNTTERRGILICDGKKLDSEIIYWKIVPGDRTYESPITPHHGIHHDRYLTFEYDHGGWNNVRMGMECLIVIAHAMGRTLVIPPPEHLYLLTKEHPDEQGKKFDELGFEDFFEMDLLRSHEGFHVLSMKEFLEKEAVTGGLHGMLPPKNSSDIWGPQLWSYLANAADAKPAWQGKFLAMPDRPGDFNLSEHHHPKMRERLAKFGGERIPVYYDENLQSAHHIHFPSGDGHRLLQHHYAFAFFASSEMQSFYRRFVRDFMRYQDSIQCAGAEMVAVVRADALASDPSNNGSYYALHIRRGDFQFKEVKIGADQIVKNLQSLDEIVIPRGSLVYISTDDPDGVCVDCRAQGAPCESYEIGKKPVGCPVDPSWKAFRDAGWNLRFLRDYLKQGQLKGFNPNFHGMVESIICSRAKVFVGTYFSTFTGYIHRLRGYHGLGESTYYHSTGYVTHPQMKKSVGHGFSREWRAGWTDDAGELI